MFLYTVKALNYFTKSSLLLIISWYSYNLYGKELFAGCTILKVPAILDHLLSLTLRNILR